MITQKNVGTVEKEVIVQHDGMNAKRLISRVSAENEDFTDLLFAKSTIKNSHFENVDFSKCDFVDVEIINCTFDHCTFNGTFLRSTFKKVTFAYCIFKGATFSKVLIFSCVFVKNNLSPCSIRDSYVEITIFIDNAFSKLVLYKNSLSKVCFANTADARMDMFQADNLTKCIFINVSHMRDTDLNAEVDDLVAAYTLLRTYRGRGLEGVADYLKPYKIGGDFN